MVAILARSIGLWWLNACRIVAVVDEDGPVKRFGFAYGTLPDHAGSGEERFLDRVGPGRRQRVVRHSGLLPASAFPGTARLPVGAAGAKAIWSGVGGGDVPGGRCGGVTVTSLRLGMELSGGATVVKGCKTMRYYHRVSASTLLLSILGSSLMAADTPKALFDFAGADAAKEWQTINDGVMGGVSEGKFKITDRKTLEFFGTLSLENNGGFASVRTTAKKLGLEKGDALVAKVRGDGREYTLNLYVNKPLIAFSYRATMQTKRDEWIEVKVPLDKFEATSFGRVVKDAGPVDPQEVNGLGFLLGDKKAGPLSLEVEWIKLVKAAK